MKSQSRRSPNHSLRNLPPSREWICAYAATALAGAALASSVLVTADAMSVYEGGSLPQVLLLLVTGLVASFGKTLPLPQGRTARLPLVLLAVLLGWLVLSTTSATWLANGRAAWNGFWHITGLVVFGCFFSQLCRSPKVASTATQLLVVGAIMLSVHAVHQVTVSMPEARARYENDPDRELAELGLDAPPGSALRLQFESRLRSPEPLATFALTNSLAVVLSAALLFQGILIVDQVRRRPLDYWALTANVAAWSLVAAACLLTKSRAALLSVGVIALVASVVVWRSRAVSRNDQRFLRTTRSWIIGVALVSIGMFAALVGLLSSDTLILSEAPKSLAFRLEYWQATSKMILDYPLTGVGLGNFQSYYPRYKLETASETIADPHNWLFDIAACCSLPVLALVLLSLAMILVRSFAMLRQQLSADAPELQHELTSSSDSSTLSAAAQQSRIAQALWIGAGAGWMLTAALQWFLQESVDVEAAGLGLIVSLIALVLMRRAPEPSEAVVRGAALAALATMLVSLLASGSWQASGIALPLIAWLAIGSSFGRSHRDPFELPDEAREQGIAWGISWQTAALGVLLLGFIFQTWRPVSSSWTLEQQAFAALQRGDIESARLYAGESRTADRINPDPYRLVVQMLVYQAESEPAVQLESLSQRMETAIGDLLRCDPASNLHWKFATESVITLAAAAQDRRRASPPTMAAEDQLNETQTALTPLARRMLERAVEYQQEAIERYPSSVALHAQLGVILALLDQPAAARAEIERAFALSDATPHLDRKLNKQQIWLPAPLATTFPTPSIQRPAAGSSWVLAEPLCRFLRNKQ